MSAELDTSVFNPSMSQTIDRKNSMKSAPLTAEVNLRPISHLQLYRSILLRIFIAIKSQV